MAEVERYIKHKDDQTPSNGTAFFGPFDESEMDVRLNDVYAELLTETGKVEGVLLTGAEADAIGYINSRAYWMSQVARATDAQDAMLTGRYVIDGPAVAAEGNRVTLSRTGMAAMVVSGLLVAWVAVGALHVGLTEGFGSDTNESVDYPACSDIVKQPGTWEKASCAAYNGDVIEVQDAPGWIDVPNVP